MKKLISSLTAVALALGMWSCANEQPAEGGPGNAAALQFTIKKPVVPFATRADIATENERTILQLVGTPIQLSEFVRSLDALDETNIARTGPITMEK